MANLRSTLYAWRDNEAAKKGVELFRVLPNSALDDIVRAMPKTKEELTAIKGIKDAKFQQYGNAILAMVKDASGVRSVGAEPDAMTPIVGMLPKQKAKEEDRTLYSVSSYLDIVNRELWRMRGAVKGEVTSYKEQGKAVYFSLRDAEDGSALSVFMWLSDFALAGIELSEGLEVIVEGRSEIYKPMGKFSFRAETIELVGEGAFKKAYDELKKKLDAEGVFAAEKKRPLPEHPVCIGLVTSRTGAVIHDFLSNLGKFGFHIAFYDSRVEGAGAVKDILAALTELESRDLDVLVLIRGGGSLESLQAFNNELVVRKIATFPAVTVCAIGHDKDVPLVQLAADYSPSTPTATTTLLNASWEETIHELALRSRSLAARYAEVLWEAEDDLRALGGTLKEQFSSLIEPFYQMQAAFQALLLTLNRAIGGKVDEIRYAERVLLERYRGTLHRTLESLAATSVLLRQNDPMRQLKLGFSILSHGGKVLRSVGDIAPGERFEARLSDGTLVSELKEKHEN